jgi:hypothetical protein
MPREPGLAMTNFHVRSRQQRLFAREMLSRKRSAKTMFDQTARRRQPHPLHKGNCGKKVTPAKHLRMKIL